MQGKVFITIPLLLQPWRASLYMLCHPNSSYGVLALCNYGVDVNVPIETPPLQSKGHKIPPQVGKQELCEELKFPAVSK